MQTKEKEEQKRWAIGRSRWLTTHSPQRNIHDLLVTHEHENDPRIRAIFVPQEDTEYAQRWRTTEKIDQFKVSRKKLKSRQKSYFEQSGTLAPEGPLQHRRHERVKLDGGLRLVAAEGVELGLHGINISSDTLLFI